MNVYIQQNKLQNAYIGEYKELVLKQVFDFKTNSRWDFTMTSAQWYWAIINTSWWYCEWAWPDSNYNNWNAVIWKRINAKRFWGRVKFMHPNNKHWWVWIWVFASAPSTNLQQSWNDYADYNIIEIEKQSSQVASWTVSISANTIYYLDVKFDNWLYTCTLSDSNLNPIKTITYQSSDTIWECSWFFGWGWTNRLTNWRVYEYREAYDNN